MNDQLIQWPRAKYWDKAWNPIVGCKPCSPACENCYAAAWANRFGQSFKPHASTNQVPPRKGIVFCGNMTDLFGEWMFPSPGHYIMLSPEDLIAKCDSTNATYLWLTKRVHCMGTALSIGTTTAFDEEGDAHYLRIRNLDLRNHYFGFTAENNQWFGARTHAMYGMFDMFNIWLSAEPLLGPLDLRNPYAYDGGDYRGKGMPFKWVVVGCESGPNRRPCKIEWVESIVEQCLAAKVPVFVKQICLPNGKFTNKIEEFPKHLQIRQVPWL